MEPRASRFRIIVLILTLIASIVLGQQAVASPGDSAIDPLVQQDAGSASFAVDLDTGIVLQEENGDVKLPPASTTKLLTAITAQRVLDINLPITIVESDLVPEEFSRMGLEPGDVATVEQLLYGALVPSGGDAALALARTAGAELDPATDDPIARFVEEMNRVAASLGMQDSAFGNPVGQDDERSWTTARDLVRAGAAVLEDPLLANIVRTPWASVVVDGPNGRELIIENSNQFVLFDDAIGIKTGTTDAAGQNLIAAFKLGDHTIVTVVLGSGDRYADTTAMLDAIHANWSWLLLGRDGSSLGAAQELDASGLWMPVGRTVVVRPDQIQNIGYQVILDSDSGPSKGSVIFTLDGNVLAELPVYPIGQPGSE